MEKYNIVGLTHDEYCKLMEIYNDFIFCLNYVEPTKQFSYLDKKNYIGKIIYFMYLMEKHLKIEEREEKEACV